MKVSVIGTGYVGLITGVCLASKGHEVICVDINQEIVKSINESKPHIYERNLGEMLNQVILEKKFYATSSISNALDKSELAIIAVGTPSKNGEINLSFVKSISSKIGEYMNLKKRRITVIVKSTVIPGTTDTVVKNILEKKSNLKHHQFGLGMNPEFLKEGSAISDFMNPDRIVFGTDDEKSLKVLENLYSPWECQKIIVNTRTAEFIKYANNTILASQISLSNELSLLASKLSKIDIMKVIEGVQSDYRWSFKLNEKLIKPQITTYQIPGCGFGGSCFPKDVEAISALGEKTGLDMKMTRAITEVNEKQPYKVSQLIEETYGTLKSKKILLLGVAFKPDTDDIRDSASIKIIESLYKLEARLTVHDPIALKNYKKHIGNRLPNINMTESWKDCLDKNEIIIIATNWSEYKELSKLKNSANLIFDCRRLLNASNFKNKKYLTFGYNF